MTYAEEVLADSPYVWLRFDEESGSTVEDHSGNNRDATIVGGLSRIDGPIGRAISGSGATNQYVNTGLDLGTILNNSTVEFWIRTTDTTDGDYWMGGVGSIPRFQVEQDTVPSVFQVRLPAGSGTDSGYNFNLASNSVWDGEWHHIAIVVNVGGGGFGVRLYIDGQPHATVSSNTDQTFQAWSQSLYLIGRNDEGTHDAPPAMDLAEFAFYTSMLSDERIEAHFNAPPSASLPAPENVMVTITDVTEAEVTWDAVDGADVYEVEVEVRAGVES